MGHGRDIGRYSRGPALLGASDATVCLAHVGRTSPTQALHCTGGAGRSRDVSRDAHRDRAVRVRVAAVAALETRGGLYANDQAFAAVKNVSRTGIGLETGQPPIVGQRVILRLALGERTHEILTIATRVARRGQSNVYEVGLDWRTATPQQLAFLDEVLLAVEGQSPL
jgi:hypothetical protein